MNASVVGAHASPAPSLPIHLPGTAHLAAAAAHPFGFRLMVGITGILVAAIMSGLNNRVGALSLPDIRGGLGLGMDEARWIGTVYSAAELIAMPFAAWFSVTFSLRRFHMAITLSFALLAFLMPFASDYGMLLAMRAMQGLLGGAMIPVLMSAALRFFPLTLRLYGLSLYSLTSVFAPNLAVWLAAVWTDELLDWRFAYWQVLPLSAFAFWAVSWGIPQDPVRLERLRSADWMGLATGAAALGMIAVGLDQGERLDWFASDLILWLFGVGGLLFCVFLITEFYHHAPFVKLQLLGRRNLWLSFLIFVGLLITLLSGSLLPSEQLTHIHGFRPLQNMGIGLIISIPQLVVAPATAFLLYRKWVDARIVMALGLLLVAIACWNASLVTSEWMVNQFVLSQMLQMIGQPMAVVSMLFLATSVVAPMEGPFVSGLVNTLRAFGTLLGSTIIGSTLISRGHAHGQALLDHVGRSGMVLPAGEISTLAGRIGHEAFTLSIADCYRYLGLFALLLAPLTLLLEYIAPPALPSRGPAQG